MKKILLLFLLCPLLAFTHPDWKVTTEADTVTCIPVDLPAGKKFQLKFYKVDLGGMDKKTWLARHVRDRQSAIGKTTKSWEIKPAQKHGEWKTSNFSTTASGTRLAIGYVTGTATDGTPYVFQFISSMDLGVLLKYGAKINSLGPVAEKELMGLQVPAAAPSKTSATVASTTSEKDAQITEKGLVTPAAFKKMTGKKRRQYVWKQIRTQPGRGVDPYSVETVLVHMGIDVTRGSMTSKTYLLLKDGTAYTGCTTPIEDLNVEVSRQLEGAAYRKNPKWTRWKKIEGRYALQNPKSGKWVVLKDVEKALPGKKGERLDNTFWTFSGSPFWTFSVNQTFGSHRGYYKFTPDGRFEIFNSTTRGGDMGNLGVYTGVVTTSDKTGSSGNTVVIADNVGGGTSSRRNDGSKNTGTYKIDGYTIEFHHDNGWVRRVLFHFPGAHHREYILIDKVIYWIDQK